MTDINLMGLHSDETEFYHSPLEPKTGDLVTIRFRTAKDDVDEVVLICKDQRIILEKETNTEVFDYYMTRIVAEEEILRYYFEVRKNEEVVIFNRRGAFNDTREQYQFAIVPGFETPDWAFCQEIRVYAFHSSLCSKFRICNGML